MGTMPSSRRDISQQCEEKVHLSQEVLCGLFSEICLSQAVPGREAEAGRKGRQRSSLASRSTLKLSAWQYLYLPAGTLFNGRGGRRGLA